MSARRRAALDPAARVAREREGKAVQAMRDAQAGLEAERGRLSQLEDYRREYAEQMHQAGSGGLSVGRLQQYRGFLHSLDRSIDEVVVRVQALEGELEKRRHRWSESRARVRALEAVLESHRRDESRAAARREQTDSDERAGRPRRPVRED